MKLRAGAGPALGRRCWRQHFGHFPGIWGKSVVRQHPASPRAPGSALAGPGELLLSGLLMGKPRQRAAKQLDPEEALLRSFIPVTLTRL